MDAATGRAEVFRPGSFIVEMVDRWHHGQNIGASWAELLVIDLIEGNASNVLMRD